MCVCVSVCVCVSSVSQCGKKKKPALSKTKQTTVKGNFFFLVNGWKWTNLLFSSGLKSYISAIHLASDFFGIWSSFSATSPALSLRKPVCRMRELLLSFRASLDLFHWAYYLDQINCKLQAHKHVRYLVACEGRLEGADIIERPSACHHSSLALVQTVRKAAALKHPRVHSSGQTGTLSFWSANHCLYLRDTLQDRITSGCMLMQIAYIPVLQPPAALSSLLASGCFGDSKCPYIHPVWKYVGGSDTFEVCSNWRTFPEVFASRGKQSLSFVWALMVMHCLCAKKKEAFWSAETREAIEEKARKRHGSSRCI